MENKELAKKLRDAAESGNAIAPLREIIGEKDLERAYEIQDINTELRLDAGARIVGKKIGLTSFVVQEQLGVDSPDFGILFHDMEVLNGQPISMSLLMQPKVEAEIAFVLGEDLDMENMTIVDVIAAIDYIVPAIELVGSRIENWNIRITDTIADNASASHFVIGHQPKTLDEVDLVSIKMNMTKNGDVVSTGTGADCIGSPLNAVLWLANKMVEIGRPLEAGELILSGSLGPMAEVKSGDEVVAHFEGLGSVSLSFVE